MIVLSARGGRKRNKQKNKAWAKTCTPTMGHHCVGVLSCFSLSPSLFFLLATLTLLPLPVYPSHSFIFTIRLRFLHCTLPTKAPSVIPTSCHRPTSFHRQHPSNANILPSSNVFFLSHRSLHLLHAQSRLLSCVFVRLVPDKPKLGEVEPSRSIPQRTYHAHHC